MAAAAAEVAAAPGSAEMGFGGEHAAEEGLLVEQPLHAHGMESDDACSDSLVEARVQGRQLLLPRRRAFAAAGIAGGVLLLACGALALARPRPTSLQRAQPNEGTELSAVGSMLTILGTMAAGVHEAAELTENAEKTYEYAGKIADIFNNSGDELGGVGTELGEQLFRGPLWREKLKEKFESLNATQKEKVKAKLLKKFNITSLKELRPKFNMTDGNTCQDDEELHADLCYKKCSLLTGGYFPYRISAWECCQHEAPCDIHYKWNFKICGGFGVSGDSTGNQCPHSPGGCLLSEELFGNYCYKRCSLLTYNVLSHRAGPATCCKADRSHDILAFLDVSGCDTKDKYRVGGGGGDQDPLTPHEPHLPMVSLTELA